MAVLHGASHVLNQDAQLVARAGQQQLGAGILHAAVVIQPGLQIATVDADAPPGLLQQRQGVSASKIRRGKAFQRLVLA